MAKDVDLSSHKWRELIFEGKNKEYGAYKLRQDSSGRHNKAMLIVMSVLFAVLTVVILLVTGVVSFNEGDGADAGVDQTTVDMSEDEAPEEEEEQLDIPEPEPEPEPEPVQEEVASVQMTELKIVDDDKIDESKQVKPDEIKESDAMISDQNVQSDKTEISSDFNTEVNTAPPAPVQKEEPKKEEKKEEPKKPKTEIFTAVEQKAAYPGGDAALLQYVNSKIQYPAMAVEQEIQGRVIVRFVVELDGRIGKVEVLRGKHELLDKEAVRVVKSIPGKFTPAKQNGEPVRYWYTIPVTFKISK